MKSNLSYEDEEKSLSEKSAAFVQYLTRRGYLISQTAINDDAEQRRREMAKRAYHNTELLLESYRDMVWAVESIPDQIASELEMPFATLDELIDRIDLEISMENKAMEGRIHSITESRLLIDRMNEAISVLKKKPKDGELLYRVIYETYMGDEIYESVYDVGEVFMMPLHLGLRQKVVCDKILEPAIFCVRATKELTEGAKEAALKTILRCVVPAPDIGLFHLLQTHFLLVSQQGK